MGLDSTPYDSQDNRSSPTPIAFHRREQDRSGVSKLYVCKRPGEAARAVRLYAKRGNVFIDRSTGVIHHITVI